MTKIKLVLTAELEYEPDPDWYPVGSTMEDMIQIDCKNYENNPVLFLEHASNSNVIVRRKTMGEKYPDYIMEVLRQRRDLEPSNTSEDDEIMQMEKRKAFEEYISWRFGAGWGNSILAVVEEIFQVKLEY